MKIKGRDRQRIQSMSPAEFDAYNRRYEEQEAFGDRWAQAGPVGGVPWDDQVEMHAARAWDQYLKNRRHGMNPDDAAAWAAVSEIESGGDYLKKQDPRR